MSKKLIENNKTIFRLGELFYGPSGLALGAKKARVKKDGHTYLSDHAWVVDYEKDSCDTYRENICSDNPESVLCQDVRSLDINSLSDIDAFAYRFPCNDLSFVGIEKWF